MIQLDTAQKWTDCQEKTGLPLTELVIRFIQAEALRWVADNALDSETLKQEADRLENL